MSVRSQAARKLILAAAGGLILLCGLLVFLNRSPENRLRLVRTEAAEFFDALDPQRRQRHADDCYGLAKSLVTADDPTGAAAILYVIAVAPIVGADLSSTAVPDERRVESIATSDLLQIARLLFHTRRFGPADQLTELMLSRSDERPDKHRVECLRLAITIRFDLGRDDDVLAHCHELLEQIPGDAKTYRVMALVHRNHGRWESYIETVLLALKHESGDDPELRLNLADGYIRLGHTAEGRAQFDLVRSVRPDLAARAPVLQARILLQEGQTSAADAVLTAFLKSVPDDAEALVLKGTLLLADQKFEQAIQVLKSAIDSDPADEQAYYQLGQAYARNQQPQLAQETLKKHRSLLDAKVRLHEMEALAGREPLNKTVRVELAHSYAEIGLMELADFWTRAALAADGR